MKDLVNELHRSRASTTTFKERRTLDSLATARSVHLLEQVEGLLHILNEYRKKLPLASGDIDVTVRSYSLKAAKQGKESIINVEVDLSLTPKMQTEKAVDKKSSRT